MVRRYVVESSRAALEIRVATAALDLIAEAITRRGRCDIVVTGGTVGIGILAAMARDERRDTIAWDRVHVWWGDERFVPEGDPDRNEGQAGRALFDHVPLPTVNRHAFPADRGQGLATAVIESRNDLKEAWGSAPTFDLVLNGIGPDGHVASLFPGRDHGEGQLIIGVDDSPKPPDRRISMTFDALNAGQHVWIVAAGADKADAMSRLKANSPVSETPASGLHGTVDTVVWLDSAAAGES